MRFDLDHLRIFYEVVKAGSFTKAAENLHISQPSVSRAMSLFEARLRVILFKRGARGTELTADGERIADFAFRVVEEAKLIEQLIDEKSGEPQGHIKIITTPAMGSVWLANYLPGFLEKNPKMRATVITKIDNIDLSESDVAIRTYMPHEMGLIQRRIKTFKMKLYASQEYLDKYGAPQKAEDLDHHRLIALYSNTSNIYGNTNWLLTVGATIGTPRTPYFRINTLEGLVNYASKDLGIVELAEDYLAMKNSNLVNILPDIQGPDVDIYFIYPEKMKRSKRITELADYLEAHMQ